MTPEVETVSSLLAMPFMHPVSVTVVHLSSESLLHTLIFLLWGNIKIVNFGVLEDMKHKICAFLLFPSRVCCASLAITSFFTRARFYIALFPVRPALLGVNWLIATPVFRGRNDETLDSADSLAFSR